MTVKPICFQCTNAARTVDTPSVKVRVERSRVWKRSTDGVLMLTAHCHGQRQELVLIEDHWKTADEDAIERLEVFRGT